MRISLTDAVSNKTTAFRGKIIECNAIAIGVHNEDTILYLQRGEKQLYYIVLTPQEIETTINVLLGELARIQTKKEVQKV